VVRVALGGRDGTIIITATATADQVRALFAASAAVQDATSPASVDLVSPTEWLRLGGCRALPARYGTSNIPGTAQASRWINISGLTSARRTSPATSISSPTLPRALV
jgi:hypothetical protein